MVRNARSAARVTVLATLPFLSGADAGDLGTAYGIDVWTTEEGLPQNSVQAIVQTRDGYLWLGTQEGLVRFDGVRFTIYDAGHTANLRSSYIRALYEDRAGSLWIGTEEGGLSCLRDGVFTAAEGLSRGTVSAIGEDLKGDLWVGT